MRRTRRVSWLSGDVSELNHATDARFRSRTRVSDDSGVEEHSCSNWRHRDQFAERSGSIEVVDAEEDTCACFDRELSMRRRLDHAAWRLRAAEAERLWVIVLASELGQSVRKVAEAVGLSPRLADACMKDRTA